MVILAFMPASRTKPPKRKSSKAKPKKARTLAPRTQKEQNPGEHRVVFLTRSATGGVAVTEDTALRLAAVWSCVKVISEDVGGLPWRVRRSRTDGGSDIVTEHHVDWLINTQANPETSSFTFRETLLVHALTWGNGYAEIERDMVGRPVWLWQLPPDRCCLERRGSELVLRVLNDTEEETFLPYADVFHIKGLSFDGLVGYPVIRYFAALLGGALSADQNRADFWANDSTPGGFLTTPNRLGEMAVQNLVKSWEARHKGPKNRRNVAVLEEGLTWEQTSLPPETAQLVEQLQLSVEDICRIFRVSPHKVMSMLRAVGWSTLEQMETEHVTDTLTPWVLRCEQEANVKLFGRKQRGEFFTKINLKARLRGDTTAQTTHLREMMDRGVYDVNDALGYLDQNPIGPLGDKRAVQRNMTTLEKLGVDPEPVKPAATPRPEPMSARDICLPLLEEACGRILRRACNRAADAVKRLSADELAGWFEKFAPEHDAYALEALTPSARALVKMASVRDDGKAILRGVVDDHLRDLKSGLTEFREWPALAPAWAEKITALVLALADKTVVGV